MQSGNVEEIRERRIGQMVFAPTRRTLSEVDQRFPLARAQNDAESKLTDLEATDVAVYCSLLAARW